MQGTWQFTSADLLRKPMAKRHVLRDDLESFLWLLLYVVSIFPYLVCPLAPNLYHQVLRYRYRLPNLEDRSGARVSTSGLDSIPDDVILDDEDNIYPMPEPRRPSVKPGSP